MREQQLLCFLFCLSLSAVAAVDGVRHQLSRQKRISRLTGVVIAATATKTTVCVCASLLRIYGEIMISKNAL